MKPNTKLSAHQIFLKSIVFVGILIGFFISIDLCIPGELDPENRLKYRDFVETMDPLIGPLHKIHVDVS